MRVCVVGGGISGLAAATYLRALPDTHVTVFEQAAHLGGRADVDADGEHCPRFFMDDYTHLFALLRQIPLARGGTVHEALREARRFSHTDAGWVEISHLYRFLAREIPWRQKIAGARSWRPTPLLAEQHLNANRYGSLRNYSALPLLRMGANLFRSKIGYVLPGPTDEYLVDPWVNHLREQGVEFAAGRRVTGLEPISPVPLGARGNAPGPDVRHQRRGARGRAGAGGVRVTTDALSADFEVVVVTAFVPDLVHLLNSAGLDHTAVETRHTHCVAHTFDLDPREKIFGSGPTFYCRDGINVLVQPEHHRCVVLCTTSRRTDAAFVLPRVREFLELSHDPLRAVSRVNQRPGEGIMIGDYLRPERILRRPFPGLYFAGSCMRNSYPLDSAEGAARSAFNAFCRIRRDFFPNFLPIGDSQARTFEKQAYDMSTWGQK